MGSEREMVIRALQQHSKVELQRILDWPVDRPMLLNGAVMRDFAKGADKARY